LKNSSLVKPLKKLIPRVFRSISCAEGFNVVTSSRKTVPPLQVSSKPSFSSFASVKAPFVCPNMRHWKFTSPTPASVAERKVPSFLTESSCIAFAIVDFPVPGSPVMSMGLSKGSSRASFILSSKRNDLELIPV